MPEFPWEAFLRAQEQKNKNRQVGPELIGQTFASLGQTAGNVLQKRKQQKVLSSSGIPPELQNIIRLYPDQAGTILSNRFDPLRQSEIEKNKAMTELDVQKAKGLSTGVVVPFEQARQIAATAGNPAAAEPFVSLAQSQNREGLNKQEMTDLFKTVSASASGARGNFYEKRGAQAFMSELPSRSGPNTAAGAAYMVKVSARQGKSIIAKAGSPQQIALASGDIARAVMRAAPQLEAMRGSDFTNNLITNWNQLTQRLTADPTGKDVPKIRKQMYDLLDELDKSASPWIENQLKTIEDTFEGQTPKNWEMIKKREMGSTISDIPFIDVSGSNSGPKSGAIENGYRFKGGNPSDPKEWEPIK